MIYPAKIGPWLNGKELISRQWFNKYNPATGEVLAKVSLGNRRTVETAVSQAAAAFPLWSKMPLKSRAEILKRAARLIEKQQTEISLLLSRESGKPVKSALGEVVAAARCGRYLVEQGPRFWREKLASAVPKRSLELVRQSIGVGALITPFNNPLAGIAWKTFPALLCGNTVVVKSHELTPLVAVRFAAILKEAGLPDGAFNVIQGSGSQVGQALVSDSRIKFVSFTGSVATGRKILRTTAERLAKVSIEAGGKNPLIVCADADINKAVEAAVAGAFVDAGQRCAATSRIIIFDKIYDEFKTQFLDRIAELKIGVAGTDDYGAIITEARLKKILTAVRVAVTRGAILLAGGRKINRSGYFMEPTVLENVHPADPLSQQELFGPVVALYRVKDLSQAIQLANQSEFRLASAIHTKSKAQAEKFIQAHLTGVVRVNGPTHGSEPEVPFGGVGLSGNGWREPGLKALDFYADWKQISFDHI